MINRFFLRFIFLLVLSSSAIMLSGCIGIYNNSDNFLNLPDVGTSELDVLKTYGTPSFSTNSEDRKVYTYKVRDVMYIVCIGLYRGYDLVVVMRDGRVEESEKVKRPSSFTLFQPIPWAVSD